MVLTTIIIFELKMNVSALFFIHTDYMLNNIL